MALSKSMATGKSRSRWPPGTRGPGGPGGTPVGGLTRSLNIGVLKIPDILLLDGASQNEVEMAPKEPLMFCEIGDVL